MGSNKKDETKLAAVDNNKSQVVPDELDLDKNPIKYASATGELVEDSHDKAYMELTLRSGQHSPVVQKLLRQRIEQRAKEFPRWPGDDSSGTRCMWIESRFWFDRERLTPDFDDDWRKYRVKYLDSLELDPREPVHVPEYEKALLNPIRRFYMKGGDFIENHIIKRFITQDKYRSSMYRVLFTRTLMGYFAAMGVYYWFRYHHSNWEKMRGPRLFISRPIMYPNHPKFPYKDIKTEPAHHWDQGFLSRKVFTDLRDYEDVTVVL